ncbi:MAG TPA: metallopeptidase TldD-related protein [Longimicrobium sp.]|nr:metallopeptidase TldD-related protein [Longimicrobium sp.]
MNVASPRRPGEAGWFERGLCRTVHACGGAPPRALEMAVERGRVRERGGAEHRFGGPPPAGWGPRLSSPAPGVALDAVAGAIEALVAPYRGRVRLAYSAAAFHRRTAGNTLDAPVRPSFTWALTGSLISADGGTAWPLGWSGAGDGVGWLAAGAEEELREMAGALERARPLEAGRYDAVLGPDAAAVLVHETVGHLAEAAPGAPPALGVRLASEALSVEDDPGAPGGAACYAYDDEGVRSLGPTPVLREGVVVGELHTADTARASGALPTANGRAAGAWHPPLPRISNLVCAPGDADEGEMVDRVGRGLYLRRLGEAGLSRAGVSARVVLAERIEGGARTGEFLTGGWVEEEAGVLRRVVEAGDAPRFRANAMCGRAGQLLCDVGTCSPALRVGQLRIVR